MIITALVENKTTSDLKARHGLSLYIQTKSHKILFDLGPDNSTLFENAKKRGVDLSKIDTVILSHGHIDHGGGLEKFLSINHTAKIYAQRKAFAPHYSKVAFLKVPIGLEESFTKHPQIILLDRDYQIDKELRLFTVSRTDQCPCPANDILYDSEGKDHFSHEQNLLLSSEQVVLITGCGHTGIINILETAKSYQPNYCIGGFHLFDPITKKTPPDDFLDEIAAQLRAFPQIQFYTCHCTGYGVYKYLAKQLKNLSYLFCGDTIEIGSLLP